MRSIIRGSGWSGANGGRSSPGQYGDGADRQYSFPSRTATLWSEDFAAEPLSQQGLFIHEMTHVWQSQTRGRFYLPLMRHPFCRYAYELDDGRPFERYGLEQQAEIVRHVLPGRRG